MLAGGGGGPGGNAAGGVAADLIAEQLQQMRLEQATLSARVASLVSQHVVRDVAFSVASPSMVRNFCTSIGLRDGGRLELPSFEGLGHRPRPTPFVWGGMRETAAAPRLQALLDLWVRTDAAPPVANAFCDVQSLAAHSPLTLEHEGAIFRGVPDCVVLNRGLDLGTLMPLSSCCVSVDWKTPAAFESRPSTTSQALLQAIGLARFGGAPVFVTDLATGFRCWLVVDKTTVYTFHSDARDLTLAEGVLLIRYFIRHGGRLSDADARALLPPAVARAAPHSPSAALGGDGGVGASPKAPADGGASARGGAASSSSAGDKQFAAGPAQGSPDDPVGWAVSPAEERAAHLREFEMDVRAIAEELHRAGGTYIMRAFE